MDDRPVRHLNENDPTKVDLAVKAYRQTNAILKERAPALWKKTEQGAVFILNVYDEHLPMVESVIAKYSDDADLVFRCGYTLRGCGPVIGLVFEVHDGVQMQEMLRRKTGVDFDD